MDTCPNTLAHLVTIFRHSSDAQLLAQKVGFIGRVARGPTARKKGDPMPLKPARDVWYELLWEEAGSRGLDTWYALEQSGLERDAGHPLGADRDEAESDAGSG
jgi:hypothetical protein